MKKLLWVGSATMLLLSHSVVAELVTADDIDDMRRINFNNITEVVSDTGPVQIGTITGLDITASSEPAGNHIYIHRGSWGLNGNGNWDAPKKYLGFNTSDSSELLIQFNFGHVSQVGAFMNHSDVGGDLVITAYDSNMQVLEMYNITDLAIISTPGGLNEGAFRGIERPQADIAVFGISGHYPVIDHLTFSTILPFD